MSTKKLHLMAHLMRRAGFGATREELEALSHADYEATVERLLDTDHPNMMSLDMMRPVQPRELRDDRFHWRRRTLDVPHDLYRLAFA